MLHTYPQVASEDVFNLRGVVSSVSKQFTCLITNYPEV